MTAIIAGFGHPLTEKAPYLTDTNVRYRTSSPMRIVSARLTVVTQTGVVPRAGC